MGKHTLIIYERGAVTDAMSCFLDKPCLAAPCNTTVSASAGLSIIPIFDANLVFVQVNTGFHRRRRRTYLNALLQIFISSKTAYHKKCINWLVRFCHLFLDQRKDLLFSMDCQRWKISSDNTDLINHRIKDQVVK